jgi:hypothetical protein
MNENIACMQNKDLKRGTKKTTDQHIIIKQRNNNNKKKGIEQAPVSVRNDQWLFHWQRKNSWKLHFAERTRGFDLIPPRCHCGLSRTPPHSNWRNHRGSIGGFEMQNHMEFPH